MAELSTAEQAAYQASFNRTKKQAARDKGAADAGGSALERARQRALGGDQQAPAPRPVKSSGPQQFVQVPARGTTYRVPDPQWYALSSEQQNAYLDGVDGEATEEKNESLALQYSMSVGDQVGRDAKRITNLERLVESLVGENLELRRRQDTIDTTLEISKSDELIGAQSDIAQQVTNLAAVKAEALSTASTIRRESEVLTAGLQQRMADMQEPMATLEGRLKGASSLYQEGIIANQGELAEGRSEVRQLRAEVAELKGQANAIGNPVTRPELRAMVTSTVAAEFPAQLPGMVSKELAVQKATGELGEGIEIDRGYLAQSLENSDERSKRFEISEQQIEESKFTNPTERAIRRALKKGSRR